MAHYFFHVGDLLDDEGVDLADDDVARSEASRLAGALLTSDGDTYWNNGPWRLRVVRDDNTTVCRLAVLAQGH